jgi:hypothetical protein
MSGFLYKERNIHTSAIFTRIIYIDFTPSLEEYIFALREVEITIGWSREICTVAVLY